MAFPPQTPEQRADALAKAAAARKAQTDLRNRLARCEVTIAEALEADDAQGIKVSSFLRAVPGVGKVRAEQLMTGIGIAGNRRVRGLGPVQRKALATALRELAA